MQLRNVSAVPDVRWDLVDYLSRPRRLQFVERSIGPWCQSPAWALLNPHPLKYVYRPLQVKSRMGHGVLRGNVLWKTFLYSRFPPNSPFSYCKTISSTL